MNRIIRFCSIATMLSAAIVSCGCSQGSDRAHAEHLVQGISQAMASTAAANNQACKLLSRDEVSAAIDAPVDAGHDWNIGCEWSAGDKAVQVVVVNDDWEPLAKSSGGESLPGIGKEAFVGPWLGDIRAGALIDTRSVYVITPTRDVSVRLLRQAVARLPSP